jgi:hypothetical protein
VQARAGAGVQQTQMTNAGPAVREPAAEHPDMPSGKAAIFALHLHVFC